MLIIEEEKSSKLKIGQEEDEEIFCSIKPEEVPPIPDNKFLARNVQTTNTTEMSKEADTKKRKDPKTDDDGGGEANNKKVRDKSNDRDRDKSRKLDNSRHKDSSGRKGLSRRNFFFSIILYA